MATGAYPFDNLLKFVDLCNLRNKCAFHLVYPSIHDGIFFTSTKFISYKKNKNNGKLAKKCLFKL